MDNRDVRLFEDYWNSFLVKVKGRMMKQAYQQELTYPLLRLILKDASLSWDSDFDENGRWLKQYSRKNPQKGKQIRQIILEDMRFSEIFDERSFMEAMDHVIPTVGAIAGYCVSSVCDTGRLVKVVSTTAPVVLLYPVAKSITGNERDKRQKALMKRYISQLDKYKHDIILIMD